MRVDTMSASRRGDSWSRPFFKFGKKGRDQGAEYSAKCSSNPDGRTETLRLKDDVEESKCRPYTDNSWVYHVTCYEYFYSWDWSQRSIILCGDLVFLLCFFDISPQYLIWIGQRLSLHLSHLIQNLPLSSPSLTQSISSMRARIAFEVRSRLLEIGEKPVPFS